MRHCRCLSFLVITLFVGATSRQVSQQKFDSEIHGKVPDLSEFECKGSDFWTNVTMHLFGNPPDPPKDAAINLVLFVRTGDKITRKIIAKNGKIGNLTESGFNPARKTVLIAHGFMVDGRAGWIDDMLNAYMAYEDINAMVLDWGALSLTSNYPKAARNTQVAGGQAAKLFLDIMDALPQAYRWGPIHLIGGSLGAHVVGRMGYVLKTLGSFWPVTRITGLDPALPCFAHNQFKLDQGDAPFVDIIHTNGNRKGMALGIFATSGHIDFYVNGGEIQPRCKSRKIGLLVAMCSHESAAKYFTESLKNTGQPLIGFRWHYNMCDAYAYTQTEHCSGDCRPLGIMATKPNVQSQYFVPTARDTPFHSIAELDREEIHVELERIYEAQHDQH